MKVDKSLYMIFKDEAGRWLEKFGLTDWSVTFCHESLDPPRWSQVRYNLVAKQAVISLNTEVDDSDVPQEKEELELEIRKCAFHEVVHLLLAELDVIARSREYDEDWLELALHSCIHRLENVVFNGGAK